MQIDVGKCTTLVLGEQHRSSLYTPGQTVDPLLHKREARIVWNHRDALRKKLMPVRLKHRTGHGVVEGRSEFAQKLPAGEAIVAGAPLRRQERPAHLSSGPHGGSMS